MENSNPYWYRDAVGGLWEELGKLQIEFLVGQGLLPQNYLLDIGCGSLRGGIHFIQYLEPEHYFGIDKNKELLDAGRIELHNNNLIHKNPKLVQMENFEFLNLNQKFDYALAQSVFTHLTLNDIIKCLMNVEKVFNQSGKFYATFFENKRGKFYLEPLMHPKSDGPDFATYFDQDPYHYDFETFEWICEGTKLKAEYIGDWNHPRDQKMMVFTKM
jgi:cyclopropane fatty-acyl-phospholipid synthase-like methyltransferase